MKNNILGLRTASYKVSDLKKVKEWYTQVFKAEPYFDEPFYVGFNIGGYELGLMPEKELITEKIESCVALWSVDDINESYQHFLKCGGTSIEEPRNVGGELVVGTVKDPWGNIIGLIYNPYFKAD